MLPLVIFKRSVKFIGGFPRKQRMENSKFMKVQNGLHENRVVSLKPGTKASCIGQVVEGYAYAYAIREVLLSKLCAMPFAAFGGMINTYD